MTDVANNCRNMPSAGAERGVSTHEKEVICLLGVDREERVKSLAGDRWWPAGEVCVGGRHPTVRLHELARANWNIWCVERTEHSAPYVAGSEGQIGRKRGWQTAGQAWEGSCDWIHCGEYASRNQYFPWQRKEECVLGGFHARPGRTGRTANQLVQGRGMRRRSSASPRPAPVITRVVMGRC